jgi:hypothetical protein
VPEPAVAAVHASLRTHLTRPKDARGLYEDVRDRARGALAVAVSRHSVTDTGRCAECGDDRCVTLLEIAHDLGLHLRLATAA